jgi:hypothetical protein
MARVVKVKEPAPVKNLEKPEAHSQKLYDYEWERKLRRPWDVTGDRKTAPG